MVGWYRVRAQSPQSLAFLTWHHLQLSHLSLKGQIFTYMTVPPSKYCKHPLQTSSFWVSSSTFLRHHPSPLPDHYLYLMPSLLTLYSRVSSPSSCPDLDHSEKWSNTMRQLLKTKRCYLSAKSQSIESRSGEVSCVTEHEGNALFPGCVDGIY